MTWMAGLVALALTAAACGSHDSEIEDLVAAFDDPPASAAATPGDGDEPSTGADSTTSTTTTTASSSTTSTTVAPTTTERGGPTGAVGDPFAYDAVAAVQLDSFGDADGSIWNVVVSPPTDVTAAVLATNQFNDPPPDGIVFAGFRVALTLASAQKEPLSPSFNFSWEILGGATATAYDAFTVELEGFGCGVTPDDFNDFSEVYVGGTLDGLVCIPLPSEDLTDPGTTVAIRHVSDSRSVFAADGLPGVAAPVPPPPDDIGSGSGDGTRVAPHPFGDAVDITLDTFGDADGSVWSVEIARPEDITDAVLADNQFIEPPPAGVRYIGFEVSMRLLDAGKEPLAPGFNFSWELLGGETRAVYRAGTIDTGNFGCGPVPQGFDDFTEIFIDGVLEGWVCIPLPAEDIEHPSTQVAIHHSADSRSVFGQAA
ncbi:MAG: hypothetical protein DHS20C19_11270 [Acidimicrobiales bacterium]|nr:MAG: hypothetical protein DHS20C19_11270 [Acidimicrobiales bacterium]